MRVGLGTGDAHASRAISLLPDAHASRDANILAFIRPVPTHGHGSLVRPWVCVFGSPCLFEKRISGLVSGVTYKKYHVITSQSLVRGTKCIPKQCSPEVPTVSLA